MQPAQDIRASGNAEVVALLERWLERAREGVLRYAAIIACANPGHVDVEHAGSGGCEFSANFGLDLLKANLFDGKRPGGRSDLGADYVRYDISRSPIGWDIVSWLMDMEMTRIRAGAPAPLKVAFIGDVSRRKWGPEEQQMMEHVVRPMLALIGAVEDQRAAHAKVYREFFMLKYVVEAAKRGEKVPTLGRDVGAPEDYVTITLREAEHWPHRNSNMEAWSRFAHELRRRGENVVFVRDTAKADQQFEDFVTMPDAARDLATRAKLYALARCNLFVSNGPWHLALFGNRPWLMFNAVDPNDPFDANQPDVWRDFHGVAVGEQFPWQRPDQRIIWKTDNYENLIAAWDDLAPLLARPFAEAAE